MDRRIHFLKERIVSNPQKQFSVEEMAINVNLSASHLHKLFKNETGMTAVQYVRHIRLEKARELLENSFLRVKEITNEVGISDQSHFIRDFKDKYGMTPSAYRKQCWSKPEAREARANKS